MSELSINDLPSEILTKVFRKLWDYLIESTCRWSLYLYFGHDDGDGHDEQKMNFVMTTNRKFGTIEIIMGRLGNDERILRIFHRHGFNVIDLLLYGCCTDNLITLSEVLNLTPNVNHAVIQVKLLLDVSDESLDQVLPDLKKLKNLRIIDSDPRVIKCFGKSKITTMRIDEGSYLNDSGPLVDFLSSQEMLTSLTAETSSLTRWILVEMGKLNVPVRFRLTQLAISDFCGRKSSEDCDNLLRFVMSQAETLTELKISSGVPSSVYKCVFDSMPQLNTLSVSVGLMPRDNDFFEQLKENCSVSTIKLGFAFSDRYGRHRHYTNFLKKLPNVHSLILTCTDNLHKDTSLELGKNLTKVESLTIESIIDRSIGLLKFSNLKTLQIQVLGRKIDWNQFTKIHSLLTALIIEALKDESFLTSDDIDQITTNVDLQSLKVGVGLVADDRFFDIIQAKCKNLKVLDLHKSCISHGLEYSQKINLLRLCDDIKCSTRSPTSTFN